MEPPSSLLQRPQCESPLQSMGAVTTSYKGEDPQLSPTVACALELGTDPQDRVLGGDYGHS